MSAQIGHAATCSCAGAPILGSFESVAPQAREVALGASYEFHDIGDLVAGSEDVRDETGRDRQSSSLLIDAAYGIDDKWSIGALVSWVDHERKIGNNPSTTGRGLGDALVSGKYTPLRVGAFSRNGLAFGLGVRLPIGKDDERAEGITLAEDLQPSTGAYATIFQARYDRSFDQAARTGVFATTTYSLNEENDRDYRFGDAATLTFGVSHRFDAPWTLSASLRYRNADRDERNGASIPNTGGEWLDFSSGVQYRITDNLSASLTGRLPVWRKVNDALQFSTTYAYTLSVSYSTSR